MDTVYVPIKGAEACLDGFTECFNAKDAAGMDAHLHFPHIIFSGPNLTVWERPGQLGSDFFEKLAATGWTHSTYEAREPVLVAADKVHFRIRYSRRAKDETILTSHENMWLVTLVNGRWGVAMRSY